MDEYKSILDAIATQRDELKAKEENLRTRTDLLEKKTSGNSRCFQAELDKERNLIRTEGRRLDQLRDELEKWRIELMDKRERLEEEVKEGVAIVARERLESPRQRRQ